MRRIAAVWVALLALASGRAAWGQSADTAAATVPDSAAHFQVMFLAEPGDTLVFTRESDAKLFVPRDTVKTITEADVYDTLDFRNYIPGTPFELIEDRLSCLSGQVPLTYNKTVNSFINFFVVRKRNYTQTMLERKDHYFPIFEAALKRYDLPPELKYLAIVESGLNTRALSKSGAVGLWQFMGPTGRDFKLNQDKYTDERMDPYKATEAACRYLRFLYNQFSDWELALAAYNCGPGSIRRTMARTGGRTFWEIYNALPQETRSYVPQFTAVVYAMNYAEHHNLYADADSMLVLPPQDTVMLDRQVSLPALSHHLQVDPKLLVLLNPTLRRSVSPEQLPFTLNLPAEAAHRFRAERTCFLDSCVGRPWADASSPRRPGKAHLSPEVAEAKGKTVRKHHTVRRGETLFAIAGKFDVSLKELRHWNHLRGNHVKPGQRLTVAVYHKGGPKAVAEPDSAQVVRQTQPDSTAHPTAADMPKAYAANARKQSLKAKKAAKLQAEKAPAAEEEALAKAKPAETDSAGHKVHEVQPGDTLWNISRRYGNITIERLMQLNGLKDKNLKIGMKLIVG